MMDAKLTKAHREILRVLSEGDMWRGMLWSTRRSSTLQKLRDQRFVALSLMNDSWYLTDDGRVALLKAESTNA